MYDQKRRISNKSIFAVKHIKKAMSNELFNMWQKMGIKTQAPPSKPEAKKMPVFVPTSVTTKPSPNNPPVVKKTAKDEMKDIMAKRAAESQMAEAKPQAKRKTYLEEMKEIMASREPVVVSNKSEPASRKTYLDEMNQIMKTRAEPQVISSVPVVPLPEPEPASVEEIRQPIEKEPVEAIREPEPASIAAAKMIEEDLAMKELKERLEATIKFAQGDTLELKNKPEELIPQQLSEEQVQASDEVPVYQNEEVPANPPSEEPVYQAEQPAVDQNEEAPVYQPPEEPPAYQPESENANYQQEVENPYQQHEEAPVDQNANGYEQPAQEQRNLLK